MNKQSRKSISKLARSPLAFSELAAKINELVDVVNDMNGGAAGGLLVQSPLEYTEGDAGAAVLTLNLDKLAAKLKQTPKGGTSGGGGGSVSGLKSRQIVVCLNGAQELVNFAVF